MSSAVNGKANGVNGHSETNGTTNGVNGTNGANGHAEASPLGTKLWSHVSPETTTMASFMKIINEKHEQNLKSYDDLHKWSVENVSKFWAEVWDFTHMKASEPYEKVGLVLGLLTWI